MPLTFWRRFCPWLWKPQISFYQSQEPQMTTQPVPWSHLWKQPPPRHWSKSSRWWGLRRNHPNRLGATRWCQLRPLRRFPRSLRRLRDPRHLRRPRPTTQTSLFSWTSSAWYLSLFSPFALVPWEHVSGRPVRQVNKLGLNLECPSHQRR